MMKKLVFALIIFLPTFTTHAFLDLSPEDPQREIFTHLQEVGIMNVFPDGNFLPERQVTRAEALVIALRAGDIAIPENDGVTIFEDVDPAQWYAPVIKRAIQVEIISTRDKTHFRPHALASKAEFLAFLFRATQVNFSPYFNRTKNIATDIPEDSWFAPHFAYAKRFQVAHFPPDQLYRPHKTLSRREVAMMTFRQRRIMYGDRVTKIFVELQAEIEQFITLLRAGKPEMAEMHLQDITELTERLTHVRNNKDAVAASAISRALEHFSDGMRALKFQQNLYALENLHLASKQANRAIEKSENLAPFAKDLSNLINETLESFTSSPFSTFEKK